MKCRVIVFALAALAGVPEAGAATLWKGLAVVTEASAGCAAVTSGKPVRVGATYFTLFRPKLLPGNFAFDGINLYEEDRALFAIGIGSGDTQPGNYAYDGVSLAGERFGVASQPRQALLTSFVVSPASFTGKTRRLTFSLVLADKFMNIDGCGATLEAAVIR